METRPLESSEAPSDRQRDVRPTADARWLSHSVLSSRVWCCALQICVVKPAVFRKQYCYAT